MSFGNIHMLGTKLDLHLNSSVAINVGLHKKLSLGYKLEWKLTEAKISMAFDEDGFQFRG